MNDMDRAMHMRSKHERGHGKMDRKIITGTEKRIQKLNPIINLEQIS
jgi:hypothetical protein